MSTIKKITMREYNGTDYDTLYPSTRGDQITTVVPLSVGGTGANTAAAGLRNLIMSGTNQLISSGDSIPYSKASGSVGSRVSFATFVGHLPDVGGVTTATLQDDINNLGTFLQQQTGSYTGTGTSGSSNKNSITFNFVPKYMMIWSSTDSYIQAWLDLPGWFFWSSGMTSIGAKYSDTRSGSGHVHGCKNVFTLSNKTLSWYATSIGEYTTTDDLIRMQMNTSGVTYNWVAFG